MTHAKADNRTPFAFQPLYLIDEAARPVLVIVLKGTFTIGRDTRCTLAEEQVPVNVGGEYYGDDGEKSSIKYEPEVAFTKLATDVVMIGHACAPHAGTTDMMVSLGVGPLQKHVQVYGDRAWFDTAGGVASTRPIPFEKMPLVYERAFGGWDRTDPDKNLHRCELRNTVGVGYRARSKVFEDGLMLPNLEDPMVPLRSFGDAPPPAGFGFLSPHWQPRAALAGTYDEAWAKSRAPLLPKDFDRRHLNAASPGLIANGYLRGDEKVTAVGVKPSGQHFSFALPGIRPPSVRVGLTTGETKIAETNLDTVILEPDNDRALLIWRTMVVLRDGPHDVRAIEALPVP